jgi:hypothetical protein
METVRVDRKHPNGTKKLLGIPEMVNPYRKPPPLREGED